MKTKIEIKAIGFSEQGFRWRVSASGGGKRFKYISGYITRSTRRPTNGPAEFFYTGTAHIGNGIFDQIDVAMGRALGSEEDVLVSQGKEIVRAWHGYRSEPIRGDWVPDTDNVDVTVDHRMSNG